MQLIFERGDRTAPVGHALIYFTADDGAILATYVSVPPIPFDVSKYLPEIFASAMQGMNMGLGNGVVATPIPPIPERVESRDYLQSLAARRQDDLIFAGGTYHSDPTRLMAETAEAARVYGELYDSGAPPPPPPSGRGPDVIEEMPREELSEGEILTELTTLTGLLRDSLRSGVADHQVERRLRTLAGMLPAKYRAEDLVDAALIPGERGQRLAALRLERCYKLYHEDYLELPRIDREIESLTD